jgi:hypothetical protein
MFAVKISSFRLDCGFDPQSNVGGLGTGEGAGDGSGVGCTDGTGSSPVLANTTREPSPEIVGFLL